MSSPGARGCWSDRETSALIQAWGPMYVGRNGGSLHIADWRQVCSPVNAHLAAAGRRFNRSLVQCQKRVYTLKDQYKKELAKGQPTSGWRHFTHLQAFLGGGPPPGFAAKMPPASFKEEEVDEMEEEASGSVGRTATVKEAVPCKEEEVVVGREGPASAGCSPAAVVTKLAAVTQEMAAVVTKLAEVYERVEMERFSVEKEKMAMDRKKRGTTTN